MMKVGEGSDEHYDLYRSVSIGGAGVSQHID